MNKRALIVVAALCLGGCGSDDASPPTPEDEVRERADAFWTALAAGDGQQACDLATPPVQELLADPGPPVHREDGSIIKEPDWTCAKGAAMLDLGVVEGAAEEFDAGKVTIEAGDATVVSEASKRCLPLQDVDDEWLVANLPPPDIAGMSFCDT
jgi:hypothetical protein